eukprot:8506878-Pyramimonas_sp.AAC.1
MISLARIAPFFGPQLALWSRRVRTRTFLRSSRLSTRPHVSPSSVEIASVIIPRAAAPDAHTKARSTSPTR